MLLQASLTPFAIASRRQLQTLATLQGAPWEADNLKSHELSRFSSLEMTYQYSPVNTADGEIRLLTLHPGAFSDDICISLHSVCLTKQENREKYTALSYVWGSEDDCHPVYVDSAPAANKFILVTKNLEVALRHLRHKTENRAMWIDAICIDQQTLAERSSQVLLMGDIFRLAKNTVLWLGPEKDDSSHALRLLDHIGGKVVVDWSGQSMVPSAAAIGKPHWADKRVALKHSKRDQRAITHLFGRSWFKRLWVRQEVYLARRRTIACGFTEISWTSFNHAVFCIHHKPFRSDELYLRQQAVYELCNAPNRYLSYGSLRQTLRNLHWKDPRDAIYAISNTLSPADRALNIEPDYSKPVASVYQNVAVRLARDRRDLSFLSSCEIDSISIPNLATWIPDWSTRQNTVRRIVPIWSSCAWISARTEFLGDGILRAGGVSVSTIEKTHPLLLTDCRISLRRIVVFEAIKSFIPSGNLEKPYIGGGTLLEAYCMALHRGRFDENFAAPNGSALTLAKAKETLLSISSLEQLPTIADAAMVHFLEICYEMFLGRCFFSTVHGYIGLGPAAAAPGDVVCVLLGQRIPIVLRETDASSGQWRVVGPCLVPGIMYGEAIHKNLPSHCLPVMVSATSPLDWIDDHPIGMKNRLDGSFDTNPAEILRKFGISYTRYDRMPHVLEVSLEALLEGGVDYHNFDLV